MFRKESFKTIEELNVSLVANLKQLETFVRQFESEEGSTDVYQKLNQFENDTYGGSPDFATHTIGLLSLVMTHISQLVLFQPNPDAFDLMIENADKISTLSISLPENIKNLMLNLDAFRSNLSDKFINEGKLLTTLGAQLGALDKEVERLKKSLPKLNSGPPV